MKSNRNEWSWNTALIASLKGVLAASLPLLAGVGGIAFMNNHTMMDAVAEKMNSTRNNTKTCRLALAPVESSSTMTVGSKNPSAIPTRLIAVSNEVANGLYL